MIDAHTIVDKIDNYLDKFSLKASTATSEDLIAFIEEQWRQADEVKYTIYQSYIIISRMVNEYIKNGNFEQMIFWLNEGDKHTRANDNPEYIRNYYKGECCLSCGNEEKALYYLNLCYAVEPDYIFTRAPFCYTFFNQHLEEPRELPEPEYSEEIEVEGRLELPLWTSFFQMKDSIRCEVLLDYMEEEVTEEDAETLLNATLVDIKECEEEILHALLNSLLVKYKEWQPRYGYEGEDKEAFMPDVETKEQFGMLITPMVIYIIPESLDEPPHIGYLFDCSWDSEHALGFMTYKQEVEYIGGADSAFCL